jgi:F0F1-type ATP synthase assembly protein I
MSKTKKNKISALRVGSDLVASTLVGTFLGIGVDKIFGTSPVMLIVCLLISFISAFRMIHKQVL